MEQFDMYQDIAERTNGDFYLGVVGPVRTGKSTFIKRFMDLMVLPNMTDGHMRERAKDELPQSASGKTIMTTEPKFVPNEAVEIMLGEHTHMRVRMIDCVGYLVPEAEGHMEGQMPRMVHTPWSEQPMPFLEAAEMGTKKVITDHSTIGIVVTTDGSVTDIPRESYIEAEARVIHELQEMGKPFVILLNTASPYGEYTIAYAQSMEEEYGVPVLPVNVAQLKADDVRDILQNVLYQFPMREIRFQFPSWVELLEDDHWLKQDLFASLQNLMMEVDCLSDVPEAIATLGGMEFLQKAFVEDMSLGEGAANVALTMKDGLFYEILSETVDIPIENDYGLISTIRMLSETKKEYDKISHALGDVKRKGYGVVSPIFEEIELEKPEVFKQGSRFGIKLKAKGESIHLIKADVETEVAPIIGNEEQSKEFIDNLLADYETDPEKIWDLNIFGRTLHSMVSDGMQNKIYRMPEDAQLKLSETLQKIVNEGNGGLICIIL
ncbi:stage IV sporulation protein A [Chakrabartyella piscis]|uniref:stage IV sporulation protein A n=1 Tax=Chakrabartyella piscis TaxID=2918914 RepID=UPI002958728C|nr:stage IV sporulation protein A [Chakrabartyella piscis]